MQDSVLGLGISIGQGMTLIGVALGTALVLFLAWRLINNRVRRLFDGLGWLVPAEVRRYSRAISGIVFLLVAAIVLGAAAFGTAASLGVEVAGTLETLVEGAGARLVAALPGLARILLIVVAAGLVSHALQRVIPPLVRQVVSRRAASDAQASEVEKRTSTLQSVFIRTLEVVLWLSVAFLILSELGVNVTPLLAGMSVAAVAIGFGAQALVRDILAGVFVLLEDQYRIGDVVTAGGVTGLVEDFNLRRTVLRDLDFVVHFVPNGEVRVASNFTKEKSRVNLNIPVAYRTDMAHAFEVLNGVGLEMSQDPYFGPLITDQIKVLRVDSFQDSGIAIKVLGETLPLRQWEVAGELRRRVKEAFDREGIEIPFPHRTIYWGFREGTRVRRADGDDRRAPGREPETLEPPPEGGR